MSLTLPMVGDLEELDSFAEVLTAASDEVPGLVTAIDSVLQFMEAQADKGDPSTPPLVSTLEATAVSAHALTGVFEEASRAVREYAGRIDAANSLVALVNGMIEAHNLEVGRERDTWEVSPPSAARLSAADAASEANELIAEATAAAMTASGALWSALDVAMRTIEVSAAQLASHQTVLDPKPAARSRRGKGTTSRKGTTPRKGRQTPGSAGSSGQGRRRAS